MDVSPVTLASVWPAQPLNAPFRVTPSQQTVAGVQSKRRVGPDIHYHIAGRSLRVCFGHDLMNLSQARSKRFRRQLPIGGDIPIYQLLRNLLGELSAIGTAC